MEELHLLVGRLQGTVEAIKDDVKVIKEDVEIIKKYRWQLAGGATVVSVLTAVIGHFLT